MKKSTMGQHEWNLQEVRRRSTRRLLRMLRRRGIRVSKEQFVAQAPQFHSVRQLIAHWRSLYTFQERGDDLTFVWMAATVIWARLLPHHKSDEHLGEDMMRGYSRQQQSFPAQASAFWLKAWDQLKSIHTGLFSPGEHTIASVTQLRGRVPLNPYHAIGGSANSSGRKELSITSLSGRHRFSGGGNIFP